MGGVEGVERIKGEGVDATLRREGDILLANISLETPANLFESELRRSSTAALRSARESSAGGCCFAPPSA